MLCSDHLIEYAMVFALRSNPRILELESDLEI